MPRTFNAPVLVGAGALLYPQADCAGKNVPGSGGGAGNLAGGGQRGAGAGAYNGQVYS